MERPHPITLAFHAVLGFFLGSILLCTMFLAVALFIGEVALPPGSRLGVEPAQDVGGVGALIFGIVGALVAVRKVRRGVEGANTTGAGPRTEAVARVALYGLIGMVALGFLAWPWVLWARSGAPFFPWALSPLMLLIAAILLGFVVAWLLKRRTLAGAPPPRRRGALVDLTPASTALVVGVALAAAIMTLAAVSTWHELVFAFAGIPVTLLVFGTQLTGLAYFLREPASPPRPIAAVERR